MSEEPISVAHNEELSEEQLDTVAGGIIIVGGSTFLPAVQRGMSIQLGGPDTKLASEISR